MTKQVFSRIAGTGSYLPEKVLTNDDLAKFVETSDEWIAARTGIRERHIAAEGETPSDLAYHAAVRAMEAAGVDAKDLDLIVLGTTTPDVIFPSTACLVQARLGAAGCPAFDVNAACSGFVYALTVADKFIRSGAAKTALVIGAETLTRMLDAYPNLYIDLSWSVLQPYLLDEKGVPRAEWLALVQRFPERFMLGSDVVGRFNKLGKEMRRFDPFLDALPEDVAQKVARDNFLAILPKAAREGVAR